MSTWVHYDIATGQISMIGVAPSDAEAAKQHPEEGQSIAILPDGLVLNPFSETPDFARLRAWLRSNIDTQADAIFKRFATGITGQDRRYILKGQEAQGWTAGDDTAHPEKYPFMIAEAEARSALTGETVTVAQVRDEVLAQVIASTAPEAAIEAQRVAHKLAVSEAETFGALMAIATVDWAAVLEPFS